MMDLRQYFDPFWFDWIILPLMICVARIIDVTMGTMRIIFINRGKRYLAPVLGFFEVFIWIVIIGQIVRNLSNIAGYLGYAAGFALGNYIGILLENRLALGTYALRVIPLSGAGELVEKLHQAGFGVTCIDGEGITGKVKIIYTIVRRKDMPIITQMIKEITPHAFYAVEEVRSTEEGVFPRRQSSNHQGIFSVLKKK